MLSRKNLNSAELETVRVSKSPTTVVAANGEVQTREEATVFVKEFDLFVTVKLLEDTPAVLSLGKLCEDHRYSCEWTSGQKPQLTEDGRRIKCSTENYAPIVVPGLSTGSSSSAAPTSPTSLPQEAVVPALHPASTRSESTSSTVRVSPSYEPAETEKQTKMKTTRPYLETRCVICQIGQKNLRRILWMKVFQLIGTHPRVLLMNQLIAARKSGIGQAQYLHSVPKDRNCDICMRTKITRAPCRRRIGRGVPRAENFGDLVTADHKVLSEGCESRNNHRYAIVVQDLATQWIQSYLCKTKTSQETQRSLAKSSWSPTGSQKSFTLTIP